MSRGAGLEHARSRAPAEAQPQAMTGPSIRCRPLLVAGAAAAVLAIGGISLVALDRAGSAEPDVLVPAPEAPIPTGVAETRTSLPDVEVAPVPTTPHEDESAPAPSTLDTDRPGDDDGQRSFSIDVSAPIDVQGTLPVYDVTFGLGGEPTGFGKEPCTDCDPLRPFGPTSLGDDTLVIGDPENGRTVVAQVEVAGSLGEVDVDSIEALDGLAAFPDAPFSDAVVGQPVVGPLGDTIYVPTVRTGPTILASPGIDVWNRTATGWEVTDLNETAFESSTPLGLLDTYKIEGRSLVRILEPSGDTEVLHELDPAVPFTPIVRTVADGYTVTDEAGNVTTWSVPFVGEPYGLIDGSVVIPGSVRAGDANDAAALLLLRLWPDGAHAFSRFTFDDSYGWSPVATEQGVASITESDDSWLVEQWPLPQRSPTPGPADGATIAGCSALRNVATVDNARLPFDMRSGRTESGGTWLAVGDAVDRQVAGLCSEEPQPRRGESGLLVWSMDENEYAVIVEPAEENIGDIPTWAELLGRYDLNNIDSTAVVLRIGPDVELVREIDPDANPGAASDEQILIDLIENHRSFHSEFGSIDDADPQTEGESVDDSESVGSVEPESANPASGTAETNDLQAAAVDVVQGYLGALDQSRFDDAATFIESAGRGWRDRAAFTGLVDLVGDEAGASEALERWCNFERACSDGMAVEVVEQVDESPVTVQVSFDVFDPGYEETSNPIWTVGVNDGDLYVDGLPQVRR